MSLARPILAAAAFLLVASCGSDEASVVLEVELTRYQIPLQMNRIEAEFSDTEGYASRRDLDLSEGRASVRIAVKRGPNTPRTLTVVVYALHDGTVIDETDPKTFSFAEGEQTRVLVSF